MATFVGGLRLSGAAALRAAIGDPAVLCVPHGAGSIDQMCDSTEVLANPGTYLELRGFFE